MPPRSLAWRPTPAPDHEVILGDFQGHGDVGQVTKPRVGHLTRLGEGATRSRGQREQCGSPRRLPFRVEAHRGERHPDRAGAVRRAGRGAASQVRVERASSLESARPHVTRQCMETGSSPPVPPHARGCDRGDPIARERTGRHSARARGKQLRLSPHFGRYPGGGADPGPGARRPNPTWAVCVAHNDSVIDPPPSRRTNHQQPAAPRICSPFAPRSHPRTSEVHIANQV